MRRPFEKLVRMCEQLPSDTDITLGELAFQWDEPVGRIMDAIDTAKMLSGEVTYLDIG